MEKLMLAVTITFSLYICTGQRLYAPRLSSAPQLPDSVEQIVSQLPLEK